MVSNADAIAELARNIELSLAVAHKVRSQNALKDVMPAQGTPNDEQRQAQEAACLQDSAASERIRQAIAAFPAERQPALWEQTQMRLAQRTQDV